MAGTLAILFLTLVALNPSSGGPIARSSADVSSSSVSHVREQHQECTDIDEYRTTQGIVLSCLATVFACTWVAIHPNLPGPWDSGWTKLKRKVTTMTCALLAPEYMAFWALRQRLAAGKIARKFNKKHGKRDNTPRNIFKAHWRTVKEWWRGPDYNAPNVWTLTHGFFVQMGGFLLYDGKTPKRVLTFKTLHKMIRKGKVEAPDIAERDISGRSKGNFLTKLIVVLQTTWFVFQCTVRWTRHLPVTELEVVTLAFAALNVITYGLWWSKPQDAEVAVRVQLKSTAVRNRRGRGTRGDTETEGLLKGKNKESTVFKELGKAMDYGWIERLIRVPIALFCAVWRPLIKMSETGDAEVSRRSLRVPMFYAGRFQRKDYLPIMATSLLFGAFHLIPWSSSFPSTTELWLWRSSALFITIHPIVFVIAILADILRLDFVAITLWKAYIFTLPLYILARLVLLVLAFATLRHLPSGAYTNVEWTSFVPHL